MNHHNSNVGARLSQVPYHLEISAILDSVDATALLERLEEYRPTGRQGYPLAALWRAYLISFIRHLPSTNALIRYLQESSEMRALCGFGQLPHRTTFNRFIKRLEDHQGLVEECLAPLTSQLAERLPGFGEKVAIDSTVVRTHSNPNRTVISDPEASWTKKNAANSGSVDGKEWKFCYKWHALADATYGIPIVGHTTTGKRSDMRELSPLLVKAKKTHDWFSPEYVIADRGYDSRANHEAVISTDAIPIIAIRRKGGRDTGTGFHLYEGIYDKQGVPACMGMKPMEYVRSDPEKGHLYRCSQGGCHLKTRKGVRYCQDTVWENRKDNPRLFGALRRDSDEWKILYKMRQSVERLFKSMKEFRRLESHCVRSLKSVSLHATMSALAFQATVLIRVNAGDMRGLCWMVRRLA